MSVFIRNNFKLYSALSDELTQSGLKDCGPVAVRAVYRFFGIKCNFTYKDFIKTGCFAIIGLGGTNSRKFFTHESLGLITKTFEVKDRSDFINKIKSARKHKRPIIAFSKNHAYTIIPHDIVPVSPSGRYDTETGQRLNPCRRAICFYLNKNSAPVYVNLANMIGGYKNLVVCFNSRFSDHKDCTTYWGDNDVKFVEIESVWRELKERKTTNGTALMNLYEIDGIKVDIEKLKSHKYEWETTKKEYEKIKIREYEYFVCEYRDYCESGFYWAQCDHFYENNPENRFEYREKSEK